MSRHFTRQQVFGLRPSDDEFHAMLAELGEIVGKRALSSVMGVSILTLDGWHQRKNAPCASSRKLVWLLWALLLHREKIQTLFDVITWGRFSPKHSPSKPLDA